MVTRFQICCAMTHVPWGRYVAGHRFQPLRQSRDRIPEVSATTEASQPRAPWPPNAARLPQRRKRGTNRETTPIAVPAAQFNPAVSSMLRSSDFAISEFFLPEPAGYNPSGLCCGSSPVLENRPEPPRLHDRRRRAGRRRCTSRGRTPTPRTTGHHCRYSRRTRKKPLAHRQKKPDSPSTRAREAFQIGLDLLATGCGTAGRVVQSHESRLRGQTPENPSIFAQETSVKDEKRPHFALDLPAPSR